MEARLSDARDAAPACPQLARWRRTRRRSSRSIRARRSGAVHDRPEAPAGQAGDDRRRSARRRCTTRSRETAERLRIDRGCAAPWSSSPTAIDTASRLNAGSRFGDRQRDRRAGLHLRRRSGDRQPDAENNVDQRDGHRRCRARWPTWRAGPAATRSSPAFRRQRSAAARQIVDELRHQYLIAFESSGRPGWHPLEVRARGKDLIVRARSGYIRGAISPDFVGGSSCSGSSSSLSPIVVLAAADPRRARRRSFVRHERRRSERQGRLARPLGRRDPGADAAERRPHRRSRSARRRRRTGGGEGEHRAPPRRRHCGQRRQRGRQRGTAPRPIAVEEAIAAARVRSRAERGPGQLQVRQDRAAGRGQGQARPADHRAQGRSEGRLLRDRRAHRQRRRARSSTRSSGSSAPKP